MLANGTTTGTKRRLLATAVALCLAACASEETSVPTFLITSEQMTGFLVLIARTLDLAGRHAVLADQVDVSAMSPDCPEGAGLPDVGKSIAISQECALEDATTECIRREDLGACTYAGGTLVVTLRATPGEGAQMQISTPTEAPYTEGAAAFGSVITYAGDVWVTTSASGVELVDRRHIRAFIAEEDGAFTPVEFGAVQNGASVEGGVDGTYSIVPTADGKSVKISGPWKAGFVQFGDNALGAVAATFVDLVFPLDGSCQGPIAGKLVVSVELVDEVMEARYTGCNTFDFVHIEGGIDAEPPVPTADPSIFAQAVTGIRGFAAAGMNALPAPFAPFAGEATDSADWCALHMAGNATPVVVTGPAVDAALDALPTTAPVLECLSFVLSPASTAITRVTDVVATLSVVTGSLDSTENLRLIGAMYGVQAVTGETGTGAFLTFAPLASADPASHPTLAALEDAAAAYAADPVANSSPFRNCLGTVSSDAPYCTPNSTITLGLNPSRLGLWLAPAGGEPVLFSRIVGLD